MMLGGRAAVGGVAGLLLVCSLAWLPKSPGIAASELPAALSDTEFWRLSSSFSEPGGTFHSDNFVSNEGQFQTVIPDLLKRARQGGLYVGVGPEQNFTYIAALRPRMAFIVDIRRGNLHEHLLYKALFEMSPTRMEFLARLFSRDVPKHLAPSASIEEMFAAFDAEPSSEALFRINLNAAIDRLTRVHRFALTGEDRAGIEYVYRTAFFVDGPSLNYRLTGQQRGIIRSTVPTYAELMTADDGSGAQRSYLSTDERFAFLRELQSRNLIVPVVGDFAGPKALGSIGRYARDYGATVSAFYVSNVEQYLRQDGKLDAFCVNVASMPLDDRSTFIRASRSGRGSRQAGLFTLFTTSLGEIRDDTRSCAAR
jgi:hypothetical protein